MTALWLLLGCPWVDRAAVMDRDGDGVGAQAFGGEDCDDADALRGAPTTPTYADADGDGYGDPATAAKVCAPGARVQNADDCDDADPDLPTQVWPDKDGDNSGSDTSGPTLGCEGGAWSGGDCDDDNPMIGPGAPEDCFDGVDQDCDGVADDCGVGDVLVRATGLGAQLGQAALLGADFDDDGVGDLVLGVPSYSTVVAYSGASIVGGAAPLDLEDAALTGIDFGPLAGTTLAAVDWTGDGRVELVVGAPASGTSTAQLSFLELPAAGERTPTFWIQAQGEATYSRLGVGLAVGDLEGDDVPEIVAGDPYEGHYCGGAYVLRRPTGEVRGDLGTVDDYYAWPESDLGVVRITEACGDSADATSGAGLGSAVAAVQAPDGTTHFALAAQGADDEPRTNVGKVVLVAGDLGWTGTVDLGDLEHHGVRGIEADAMFGYVVVAADVDGDGGDDLLMSAPYATGEVGDGGVVYGFLDAADTFDAGWRYADEADFTLSGTVERSLFGTGLAVRTGADGGTSVVVGAADHPSDGATGAVFAFSGPLASGVRPADEADFTWFAEARGSELGWMVAAGPLDDDGADEMVAGAPEDGQGAVYLLQ